MNQAATNIPTSLKALFDRWTSAICQAGGVQETFFSQLVNILDHLSEAVILADKQNGIVYHNPVSLALHGFRNQDQAYETHRRFLDGFEYGSLIGRLLQPEEWPLHRALRGDRFSDFEVIARNTDTGRQFIGSYAGAPLYDSRGLAVVLLTIRETTDQKRTNDELKAADRKRKEALAMLDALFESAPIGLAFWDLNLRCIRLNQTLAEMTGRSIEDQLYRKATEILPAVVDHPEMTASWERILEGGEPMVNIEISGLSPAHPHQRRHWLNSWFPVRVGGRIKGLAAMLADITDYKQTTQELDASERRLRIATRAARLGVFEWDVVADRTVWENQRMFEIFGYKPDDQPPGKAEFVERIVHPDDNAAITAKLAEAIVSGRTVSAQCRIRRVDGAVRWVEMVGQFEYGSDGKPVRRVGVVMDITQRRLSEDTLRHSHDDLHRLVVERTATLQNTVQKLRDLSLTSLEALEGDRHKVARDLHDGICGSLAGIKFGLEGIGEHLKASAPESARALNNLIAHLADTIKDTKRAAANLRPLMIDELGLLQTIRRFTQQFGSQYRSVRVDTQIELNEDDIPSELKIVVYRLLQETLGNTARHSQADTFQLRLKRSGAWIILEMEDNGGGFTIQDTAGPSDHLIGNGLRNMRQRVEVCGGSFELRAQGGPGTWIRVRLPVLPA